MFNHFFHHFNCQIYWILSFKMSYLYQNYYFPFLLFYPLFDFLIFQFFNNLIWLANHNSEFRALDLSFILNLRYPNWFNQTLLVQYEAMTNSFNQSVNVLYFDNETVNMNYFLFCLNIHQSYCSLVFSQANSQVLFFESLLFFFDCCFSMKWSQEFIYIYLQYHFY